MRKSFEAEIYADILTTGVRRREPTYVYDLDKLHVQCAKLEAMPIARKAIFFATMANDHPKILAAIRDRGHGVFVNSLRHLRLVRSLGFPGGRIVYAATNMMLDEMELCLGAGVRLILDSIGQLRTLSHLASPGQEAGIRVNVGGVFDGSEFQDDPEYRFGILPSELPAAVSIARQSGVRLTGAHSYCGTNIASADLMATAIERVGRVADALPDLEYIDVAGGFGVKNGSECEFEIQKYGELAARIMHTHERRRGRPIDLAVEPGRYLTAGCGFFFVKVVDIKEREDRLFVGTNGSVAIFPRPLVYPETAVHPCEIVGPRGSAPLHDRPVWICGNSTYSRDFLARNVRLPKPDIGDTILFRNAGAYCRSMVTEFLGKDRPEEIVIQGAAQPDQRDPVGAEWPPVPTGDAMAALAGTVDGSRLQ